MTDKEHNRISEARKVYSTIASFKLKDENDIVVDLNQYLVKTFNAGDFFYLIYNLAQQDIEYISDGVEQVLGIKPGDFEFDVFIENIHPEDWPVYLEFEKRTGEFLSEKKPQQQFDYKVRYDYRMRHKDGHYVRILHQLLTLQNDNDGALYRTLGVFTDVSHLKKEGEMSYSLIGLNGAPSYLGIDSVKNRISSKNVLSPRETEVLLLLSKDLSSKEIAERLIISIETVSKHRKNMLKKTDAKSTTELLMKAVSNGWI